MKYKLTFALVVSLTSTAFAEFKAPLPEFKNEKQLAEWRAEKASESTSQGYVTEQMAFYTGKPYLESSGGYAFKYRSYNPELARWTSEDPSGFPDGANGNIYAPTPTSMLDFAGLWTIELLDSSETNPTNSDDGYISIWGISRRISAWAKINTAGHGNIGSDTTTFNVTGRGKIDPLVTGLGGYSAQAFAEFTASVNSSGVITFSPDSGNWNSPDGDLQVAATYSVTDLGDNKYKFTYTVQSKFEATGVTGFGVAGASLNWTGGRGLQDTFVSVTYKAVE
jgi:RHS repeat-associated protein